MFDRFTRYLGPQAESATQQYCHIAQDLGVSPASLALAFVTQQSFVTSNIIGATNLEQLAENIASAELELNAETLSAIEAVHKDICNPCP